MVRDGWTDGQTDRQTDRHTNRWTEKVTYRGGCPGFHTGVENIGGSSKFDEGGLESIMGGAWGA